ncbi:MAG TPA: hypothetical protein DCR55_17935 [Lentisphaeria bacterium]|nr:hypothetical protein [Lentisphaeria bacterium]
MKPWQNFPQSQLLFAGICLLLGGCQTTKFSLAQKRLQTAQIVYGEAVVRQLLPHALRTADVLYEAPTEGQRMAVLDGYARGYRDALEASQVASRSDAPGYREGAERARDDDLELTLADFGYQHLRVTGVAHWNAGVPVFIEMREDAPWTLRLRPGCGAELGHYRRGAVQMQCTLEGFLGPEPLGKALKWQQEARRFVGLRVVYASPTRPASW